MPMTTDEIRDSADQYKAHMQRQMRAMVKDRAMSAGFTEAQSEFLTEAIADLLFESSANGGLLAALSKQPAR